MSTKKERTTFLGMVLFLASWAMLFGGLFFAYFLLRQRAHTWPPEGLVLPVLMPLCNTVVLVASSGTLHGSLRKLRAGEARRAANWILATLILGAAFLALQFVLWQSVWASGVRPGSNLFGSVFYGLTLIHALHVLAGLGVLGYLLRETLRGGIHQTHSAPLMAGAMFWHFVDVVGVIMFVTVYAI